MTRFYSIPEVALALDVSTTTVRRRISDGTLEARRVGPRLIRVPDHALTAAGRPLSTPADDH